MYSFWPSLMNVIEIEFLLNIAYSIFIKMHKVLKGKTKHESLKTRTMRPFVLVMLLFLLLTLIQQHLSPFVLR